jgi:tetratricopeptide (TPR) repeat protein
VDEDDLRRVDAILAQFEQSGADHGAVGTAIARAAGVGPPDQRTDPDWLERPWLWLRQIAAEAIRRNDFRLAVRVGSFVEFWCEQVAPRLPLAAVQEIGLRIAPEPLHAQLAAYSLVASTQLDPQLRLDDTRTVHSVALVNADTVLRGPADAVTEQIWQLAQQTIDPPSPSAEQQADEHLAAGRVAEAIALYEQAVEAGEPPLTLYTSFARALRAADRLPEARAILEQTAETAAGTLGPQHPDTLSIRAQLAETLLAAGDITTATTMLERVLMDREYRQGSRHPQTLTAMDELAHAYEVGGLRDGAIAWYERALRGREAVLGPDHPESLATRHSLAMVYPVERLAEAIALIEQTVADRRRVLGEHHPSTVHSLNSLATLYVAAERIDDAVALLARLSPDEPRRPADA